MDKPSATAKLREDGSMSAMNSGQRRRMESSGYTLFNQTSKTIEINIFYAFTENLS
jgi:hypothetical protein